MYDDKLKPHADPEMREFEEALLRSIDQAARGEGRITAPEPMAARKPSAPLLLANGRLPAHAH